MKQQFKKKIKNIHRLICLFTKNVLIPSFTNSPRTETFSTVLAEVRVEIYKTKQCLREYTFSTMSLQKQTKENTVTF